MKQDESKMMLAETAAVEVHKAHSAAVEQFLDPEKRRSSNVVGMGVGIKWRKGQPTGEPALVVLVTQKLDKDQVSKADMIPSKLAEMQTDVLEIGYPFAGGNNPLEAGIQTLRKHKKIT